jgi:RNA polymerase sigma factor (sigma-70 family)
MSDYRINVKVRNARLLRAIEAAGYVSGAKFAEKVGITYQNQLIGYLNLSVSPYDKKGNLRESAEKLCVFLNKGPDELWSEEQMTPLQKNRAEREVSGEQVQCLMDSREAESDLNPQLLLEKKESIAELDAALEKLRPRQRMVLRLRFGLDGRVHTLEEIAVVLDVGKERIRQIQFNAIKQMKKNQEIKSVWGSF